MAPALGGRASQPSLTLGEHLGMPVSGLKFESLPHAIFLQRVSGPESATTLEARLGQGAFLALRLVDLLDVLTPLLLVVGNRLSTKDQVAAQLRFARVHRKLNRFDEADAAYTEAGELATVGGDRYSALLSRIGRANTMLGRGNLADAERRLEEILADARAADQRDVEARAEQGIAATLYVMGQPAEGVPHAWQAFQLYEEDDSKLRALGDMGTMLLSLGDATGAERALAEVFRRGRTQETVSNALVELMHCASYRREHVGVARWRGPLGEAPGPHTPHRPAGFFPKKGVGQAPVRGDPPGRGLFEGGH